MAIWGTASVTPLHWLKQPAVALFLVQQSHHWQNWEISSLESDHVQSSAFLILLLQIIQKHASHCFLWVRRFFWEKSFETLVTAFSCVVIWLLPHHYKSLQMDSDEFIYTHPHQKGTWWLEEVQYILLDSTSPSLTDEWTWDTTSIHQLMKGRIVWRREKIAIQVRSLFST